MDKIRKIISEEFSKLMSEDTVLDEAQISSALSFMQDMMGSIKKLKTQKSLTSTESDVDINIDIAISSINKAIQSYFSQIDHQIKKEVLKRIREIEIN